MCCSQDKQSTSITAKIKHIFFPQWIYCLYHKTQTKNIMNKENHLGYQLCFPRDTLMRSASMSERIAFFFLFFFFFTGIIKYEKWKCLLPLQSWQAAICQQLNNKHLQRKDIKCQGGCFKCWYSSFLVPGKPWLTVSFTVKVHTTATETFNSSYWGRSRCHVICGNCNLSIGVNMSETGYFVSPAAL